MTPSPVSYTHLDVYKRQDYTSKIVDTGIQQGGIESPVPDTVRNTTLQALELLCLLYTSGRPAPAHRPAVLPT